MRSTPSLSMVFLLTALAAARAANAAMCVDDFERSSTSNALGGAWVDYDDGYSTSTGLELVAGHASGRAGHVGFALEAGATATYAGIATYLRPDSSTTGIDVSSYQGIRFWVRGSGTFTCQVATSKTAGEYNHWSAAIFPTSDWQQVEIPWSMLAAATWGKPEPWDPTTVYAIQWTAQGAAGSNVELFLDDLELYTPAESHGTPVAPVIATPKINQIGYVPSARKIFVVADTTAQVGDAFAVNDAATGATISTGVLAGPIVDDQAVSGERVLQGDFSALRTPGHYVVTVHGKSSPPFEVGEHAFDELFRAALRAFFLIRCGIAIDDGETGIEHAACHLQDALSRADGTTRLELTGGWHNAGDFGKWAHMTALSAALMMWAFELNAPGVSGVKTGADGSSDGIPDLLDEVRWGLAWLLELQQADGGVIHKVDTEPSFAWGHAPEDDPYTRYASSASTVDTAVAAAAWAQAARVFRPYDAPFADRCLTAAKRAWTWVQANPAVDSDDPYYHDDDPSQEITWALGEMTRATNDPALRGRMAAAVDAGPVEAVSWPRPALLGCLATAMDENAEAALRAAATARITELADRLAATISTSGYRVAMAPADYAWGSNETLLHRASALMLAARLSGKDEYRRLAMEQLDGLLGKNPLDRCYVTGFGARTVEHPYHWVSYALGKVMPGWATGGPNQYPEGADTPLQNLQAAGTPPAKCYLDLASATGSWASNEGQTSENAALVLVTGLLVQPPSGGGGDGSADLLPAHSEDGCHCAHTNAPRGHAQAWLSLGLLTILGASRSRRTGRGRRNRRRTWLRLAAIAALMACVVCPVLLRTSFHVLVADGRRARALVAGCVCTMTKTTAGARMACPSCAGPG